MSYIYIFILVNLVTALRGELSLKIFKDDKSEMPEVSDKIEGLAGTNLTLICKLVDDSGFGIYHDDELSWGKRKKDVQFENIGDLRKLADNTLILHGLRHKSEDNKALLQFHPLFPLDSGMYFCMSLKYKLFKIIELNVEIGKETDDFTKYLKALEKPHLDLKSNFDFLKSFNFPKFMCTDDMFTCKSGSCIDNQYVCDGIKDCMDGSDESLYMCGTDPCKDKKRCRNQRCISESMCCDKFKDPGCTVDVKPSCCDEDDPPFYHHFDWPPPYRPPHLNNMDHFNLPDSDWPFHANPDKPSYNDEDLHIVDSTNDVEVDDVWIKSNYTKTRNIAIIVVTCVLVPVLVFIFIIVRRARRLSARRSQNQLPTPATGGESTPPSAGVSQTSCIVSNTPANLNRGCGLPNRSVNLPYNPNFDLPPSYDEVMLNAAPSAPPLNS